MPAPSRTEPRSTAPGEAVLRPLAEGVNGGAEAADTGAVTLHGREQAGEAPPDLRACFTRWVGEQAGGRLHKNKGALPLRPERCRTCQGAVDQVLKPPERARRPLLSSRAPGC